MLWRERHALATVRREESRTAHPTVRFLMVLVAKKGDITSIVVAGVVVCVMALGLLSASVHFANMDPWK